MVKLLSDAPFTRKSERGFHREKTAKKEMIMGKEELITNPNETAMATLHDSVTWYGINYPGTQLIQSQARKVPQLDFQNKGTRTSPARLSFVLKVPLRYFRPSIISSVPCDRIAQRAYCTALILTNVTHE